MAQAQPARIRVEERLFSLVLALLATENGLTKTEILSTVQGYRQRYSAGGDNANLERQFERDKDDIRELGVPLETLEAPDDPGNNQALRYRIPKGSYELPADLSFTAEEATLLNLAAVVWREGALSAESRRAMLKLRSFGETADEPVLSYQPRMRVRDEAFDPLNTALEKHTTVSFDYLRPGQAEAATRTVDPLALVQYGGRWHLYARLHDASAGTETRRTYLLRRIVSRVRPTGTTFTPPPGDQAVQALAELDDLWNNNTAEVAVRPGSDAAIRLTKRRGTIENTEQQSTEQLNTEQQSTGSAELQLVLHYTDLELLADELSGYGPEVRVLQPAALRETVIHRLTAVATAHDATTVDHNGGEAHRG